MVLGLKLGKVAPREALGVGENCFPEAGPERRRPGPFPVFFQDFSEGDPLGTHEALKRPDIIATLYQLVLVLGRLATPPQ